jgi:sigma-B regulation protein RsbU (phosphoserine phosphatase)
MLSLAGVAVLFLICVTFQTRFTYDSLNQQLHVTEYARVPFAVNNPSGTLKTVQPEAKAAGIADGDRPVTIDGRPVRGLAGVVAAVRGRRPGDVIQVTVDRQGVPVSAAVTLAPESTKPLSVQDWVLASFLYYLIPWFCILLGFTVAFLRPDDLLAWLLLLLMLSFSEIALSDAVASTVAGWEPWLRPEAIFYESLLNGSWGVWMLLFGQYFPDRVANGFWDRMARWGLGAPLAAVTFVAAIINGAVVEDATAMQGAQRLLTRLAPVLVGVMMMATSTFFIYISKKMTSAKTRDTRRRLKLIYVGTTVSLTPLFLVVIASLVMRKSLTHVPDWITVPSLLLLFLFPLTLAYVIVVEKALELRVVVRQGLQYALASKGVLVLRAIASAVAIFFALRMSADPALRRPQQMEILAFTVVFIVYLRRIAPNVQRWIDRRFFREAVNVESMLTELSEKVRTIREIEPLLGTVTHAISSALHVSRVTALVRQNGSYVPAFALGYSTAPGVTFSREGPVAQRLERDSKPLRVSRVDGEDDRASLKELGGELLLPLAVKDRLLGFLSLGPKLSEEPYSATDVRLLESVAAQTGLAMENSRLSEAVASEIAQRERLSRELEIAREVQQRLFPQASPQLEGVDYVGKCRPASSVGGDYYDFVPMSDGRMGIAIGDISGKGVPAALLMASLQASLRGLAIANPPALAALMANLNTLIYDASPSNRYATFFYGVYNPKSREFMYVNGGHNPPMVFRGQEVLRLEEGGPVIGLLGPAQYQQASITLERGDTMVLFTDGVSEAMNSADEEFDEERLIAAVHSGAGLKAADLIDHIMGVCDEFVAGAPQHDDMTLVVVCVE